MSSAHTYCTGALVGIILNSVRVSYKSLKDKIMSQKFKRNLETVYFYLLPCLYLLMEKWRPGEVNLSKAVMFPAKPGIDPRCPDFHYLASHHTKSSFSISTTSLENAGKVQYTHMPIQ